mmetsp:Transcript_16277/g.25325  ORF Transcript_16277/g.25325 Transcript_16277/m.25325 type:complete len:618 (+) Transcript_16277:134-1987(+)
MDNQGRQEDDNSKKKAEAGEKIMTDIMTDNEVMKDNSDAIAVAEDLSVGYSHGLEAGDHVIRWSMLALWPIQIHGIVLSVGPDIVTLVDFGYTSSRTGGRNKNDKGTKDDDTQLKGEEDEEEEEKGENAAQKENDDDNYTNTNDEAVMEEWKRRQPKGSKRFTIVTLHEEKEIKKWNKVNYGENSNLSKGKIQKLLSWFRKKPKNTDEDPKGSNNKGSDGDARDGDDISEVGSEYISLKDAMANAAIMEDKEKDLDKIGTASSNVTRRPHSPPPSSAFAKFPAANHQDKDKQTPKEAGSIANGIDDTCKSAAKSAEMSSGVNGEKRNSFAFWKKSPSSLSVDSSGSAKALTALDSTESSSQEQAQLDNAKDADASTTVQLNSSKNQGLFSSWRRRSSSDNDKTATSTGQTDIVVRQNDEGDDKKGSANPNPKEDKDKEEELPKLPKSDPTGIVLERVRFILEHENSGDGVLPPYHLFDANSECIAVWCKTGRFSNLQAAVFLHSTALGQAKTATCFSMFVASQTVTVTSVVPAGGVLGWFGATTTTTAQVGLLGTQPWLIPLLGVYAVGAVGTPYFLLMNAQKKWKKATQKLNDEFWSSADPSVFVEAINCWSGIVR